MYSLRMNRTWAANWPTEPGNYLFYGGYFGKPARMSVCRVFRAGPPKHQHMMYTTDSVFMYKQEMAGAFSPLDIEPPDLATMGIDLTQDPHQ